MSRVPWHVPGLPARGDLEPGWERSRREQRRKDASLLPILGSSDLLGHIILPCSAGFGPDNVDFPSLQLGKSLTLQCMKQECPVL